MKKTCITLLNQCNNLIDEEYENIRIYDDQIKKITDQRRRSQNNIMKLRIYTWKILEVYRCYNELTQQKKRNEEN